MWRSQWTVFGLGIELLGGKAGCSRSIGVGVAVLSAFFGCSMHQPLGGSGF